MVRFLHTSDWQMGLRAVHSGVKSREMREKRFEAALRIVDLAKRNNMDFVILAGDTFEHHDIDEVIVKRTVDILNNFSPIPTYVLPGNHDPWLLGGIWHRQSWARVGSHVVLCTTAEEVDLRGAVALYPCPLTQKRSNLDPTAWIAPRATGDNRIRIGIAHGSLDLLPETTNFPISGDRPQLAGLDYLALGDWHSFLEHGKSVYSGTIEQTSFSEREAGQVLIVEIAGVGKNPRLERHLTRSLIWAEISPSIHDTTDVEVLETDIKSLGPLASLVLRIRPTFDEGLNEIVGQRLEALKAELEEYAFLLEWDGESQPILPQEARTRLPDGVLQRVDESLATILEGRIPEGPGHVFAGWDRAVALEARALLHRLVRGDAR